MVVVKIFNYIEMNITGIERKGVKLSCDIDVSTYAMDYYIAYSEDTWRYHTRV